MSRLLDSDTCIDFLRGDFPSVRSRLLATPRGQVFVSAVAAAELRYGADGSRHPAASHARLDAFLAEAAVMPFDEKSARAYGPIRAGLERRGQRMGAMDMLIAAQALAAGFVLVTSNAREFSRIPGLKIESWR